MADLEQHKINKEDFSKRQNLMRRKYNIKQKDLADGIGVTRSYVNGVESLKAIATPGLSYMRAVKKFFESLGSNKTYDWWIDGKELNGSDIIITKNSDDIDLYKSIITDKDELIKMYKEKIKSLEA